MPERDPTCERAADLDGHGRDAPAADSTEPQSQSLRFGRERRVRKKPEYDAILGLNRSRSDARLIVYLAERAEIEPALGRGQPGQPASPLPSRLGLIVGRKVGHAPTRNRVKRLVREAFRLLQHELPAGLDVVVMPRPSAAAGLTLAAVQASLRRLVRRPLPPPRPREPRRRRTRRR